MIVPSVFLLSQQLCGSKGPLGNLRGLPSGPQQVWLAAAPTQFMVDFQELLFMPTIAQARTLGQPTKEGRSAPAMSRPPSSGTPGLGRVAAFERRSSYPPRS